MKLIPLTQKIIDNLFEKETSQVEIIKKLYSIAVPNWLDDNVECLDGYPTISEHTSKYIFEKFAEMEGDTYFSKTSLWFNNGFSTYASGNMKDWKINAETCKVIYKELI